MAKDEEQYMTKSGNGMKNSVGKDKWIGKGVVQQLFPDIYTLMPSKSG